MSTPNAHSSLGASSMHRWSNCPGSVRLSKGIESKSSSYATEGTLAHDLGERLIKGKLEKQSAADKASQLIWEKENGVTSEMKEAVSVYYDYVVKKINFKSKGSFIKLEQRFDLGKIHPGCFGTGDCVSYDAKNKKLYVADYKHGQGIPVNVKGNAQLRYYALGALLQLKEPCETVEIVVVQPRCKHPDGPIRSEILSSMDILDFSADLIEYAKATEKKDAPLKAGDWCRFCPASATCPLVAKKAVELAKTEFSPTTKPDKKGLIGGRTVSEILEWLPIFETWIKSVREYAYGEAQKGRPPKGYKLVDKRATRKWKGDERAIVDQLLTFYNLKEHQLFKKTLLSPPQLEKILPKEYQKSLANLVEKKSSGTTLVSESDKREAIKCDPASEFKKV